MSTLRKQLKQNGSEIWPITSATAVHFKYNSGDTNRITQPENNTDYQLDKFLNGLGDIFMSKNAVIEIATNVSKGPGILYNSAENTTAVGKPESGTNGAFVKCSYSSGTVSLSFDTSTYLTTSTKYAASASTGGDATKATNVAGGAKGKILYQSGAGTTAFLNTGSAGNVLGWDGTNGVPTWISIENYTTTTSSATQYSLRSTEWTNTITLPTDKGTYALFIDDTQSGTYAGVFSIQGNVSGKLEEIPLHWNSLATTTADTLRIYAGTKEKKLVLSAANTTAVNHSVIIKYKRII